MQREISHTPKAKNKYQFLYDLCQLENENSYEQMTEKPLKIKNKIKKGNGGGRREEGGGRGEGGGRREEGGGRRERSFSNVH